MIISCWINIKFCECSGVNGLQMITSKGWLLRIKMIHCSKHKRIQAWPWSSVKAQSEESVSEVVESCYFISKLRFVLSWLWRKGHLRLGLMNKNDHKTYNLSIQLQFLYPKSCWPLKGIGFSFGNEFLLNFLNHEDAARGNNIWLTFRGKFNVLQKVHTTCFAW